MSNRTGVESGSQMNARARGLAPCDVGVPDHLESWPSPHELLYAEFGRSASTSIGVGRRSKKLETPRPRPLEDRSMTD